MRVIVSGDVLDATDTEPWKLNALLHFACSGRHVVSFDPPEALSDYLEKTFDPRTRASYVRALDLDARAAGRLPADAATVRVEVTASPCWDDPVAVLPLDDALAVLGERLEILLENSTTDWHFLLGIMKPSERQRIQRAVSADWAGPLHGGGGTLKALLQTRLAAPKKALRTFVMFDSDRRHPAELDPAWEPTYPESCEAVELELLTREHLPRRYWMPKRRFIESYMPEPELRKNASRIANRGTVDAFYRMNRDQRWYFNMKKGFDGDESIENKHRCRDLYDNVDTMDRAALRKGFGPHLANHYGEAITREFDWDVEARQEADAAIPRLMRLL